MTREDWQRIRPILESALELDSENRAGFLDEVCPEPSMRQEIESLIAAYDGGSTTVLNRTAGSTFLYEEEIGLPSRPAKQLGPYKILEEIAQGGMGAVYRAVRADGQYRQEVALKVVRADLSGELNATRLRHERQILAGLDHPNIARILDGGATPEGLPYFAMDLTDGLPIIDYCEQRTLSIDERLKMFMQVCAAVQYAHQRLIIHRDIKPGNILVTADGTPKLLDFGIAKILEPSGVAAPFERTLTMFQALTPAYASPEQIRGEPITTSSDVYSLGVVLYELLAGQHPYRHTDTTPQEMARAVCETQPEKPSAVVGRSDAVRPSRDISGAAEPKPQHSNRSPVKLGKRLCGDLDNIILMALRKEPQRRYTSVEQFATDIQRHLENLPVVARKDTVAYRSSKFIRRHKTGVAAASAIALVLLLALAVTIREVRIARLERARAEQRFSDVRQLANALLFDVHDSIRDLPGSTPARKMIVEKSLKYLDSLSADAGNDPGLLRELATAYERVGELQGHYLADNLGENSNSLASYRKALKLRQQLGERLNAEWQDRLSLAESYRRMASQLSAADDLQGALTDIQKATEISEALANIKPSDLKVLYELSFDYELLGNIQGQTSFQVRGGPAPAVETYKEALAIDRRMLSLDPTSLDAQRGLGQDTLQMSNAQMDVGDLSNAAKTFNDSLQILRSVAERTHTVKDRRKVAVVYNQLALLYDARSAWKLCLDNHVNALRIYKDLVAADPKNALLRQGLAISYVNMGDTESKLGRPVEARADINQGIAVMKTLMSDPNVAERYILAQMYTALADSWARSHQPAKARDQYHAALDIYQGLHADPNNIGTLVSIATCKVGVATAERLTGKTEAARAHFQDVLNVAAPLAEKNNGEAARDAALAYAGLGDTEASNAIFSKGVERQKHWERAAEFYRRSLAASKQIPPYAQADPIGFRSVDVTHRLQQAQSELSRSGKVPD